jgi:hypothetical protein
VLGEIKLGRMQTLHLVPEGTAFAAKPARQPQVFSQALDLMSAAAALPKDDANTDKVRTLVRQFIDQFTDLRVNFPKERMARAQGMALRDWWGVNRAGAAAAKPSERFEAVFINHDAPEASGEISIASLPAKGWKAAAVTPATFTNLKQGQRFVCEFELTGEETCTWKGEMTACVRYKLGDKAGGEKQMKVWLFSPWLGVGAFCDTKEREQASIKDKFDVAYPPEKGIDAAAVYKRFDGSELRWTAFRSFYSHPGVERVGEVYWHKAPLQGSDKPLFASWQPPGVLYIAKWAYSPDERDVKMLPVFTSRAAKMWLNDKIIIDTINPDEKAWSETTFGMNWTGWSKTDYYVRKTVDAHLKKGWNTLLFKLVSNCRPYDGPDMFDLQIMDANGKPFPDILGACVPPAGH